MLTDNERNSLRAEILRTLYAWRLAALDVQAGQLTLTVENWLGDEGD
jgi:hypothetical protein